MGTEFHARVMLSTEWSQPATEDRQSKGTQPIPSLPQLSLSLQKALLSLAVRGRSGHWAFWRMQPGKDLMMTVHVKVKYIFSSM